MYPYLYSSKSRYTLGRIQANLFLKINNSEIYNLLAVSVANEAKCEALLVSVNLISPYSMLYDKVNDIKKADVIYKIYSWQVHTSVADLPTGSVRFLEA